MPYVWYLDANATPEELEASGLLDGLKDHTILRPTGADHTCTIGSRRLIDYVVIPTAIRDDIVSFKVDKARPWKPHYGLELEVKRDVGEGGFWKLNRPPPFWDPQRQLTKPRRTTTTPGGQHPLHPPTSPPFWAQNHLGSSWEKAPNPLLLILWGTTPRGPVWVWNLGKVTVIGPNP